MKREYMSTTQSEIREWLQDGKKQNASHMLVVCDTFDYQDYPVYVNENEDVNEIYQKYNNTNMQKVMEVYNLSMNLEEQLNEYRAFHFSRNKMNSKFDYLCSHVIFVLASDRVAIFIMWVTLVILRIM